MPITRIGGRDAIAVARENGAPLCMYEDPMEGDRHDLTVEEAELVAREDPGLIYMDVPFDRRLTACIVDAARRAQVHHG